MDSKELIKIMMNPARLRIAEYLASEKQGTPAEIGAALSDIPTASLYRHINRLLDAGLIKVVGEKSVRGTVEKTYAISSPSVGNGDVPSNADIGSMIRYALLELQGTFAGYFAGNFPQPEKDMLLLSTATLMLDDGEFAEMLGKIGEILKDYTGREPLSDRKPRRMTLISSPPEK